MAIRYVTKHGSASDLNGGTNATTDAWATAIKGFSTISGGDTLVFGTGTYDIARPSIPTPIPSGSSGSPTIITDNGDGVVTFQHPGTSNRLGLINFATGGGKSYISFIGTSVGQLVFDGEDQAACATLLYFSQGIPSLNSHLTVTNCELKNSAQSAVLGGHTPNLTFDGCLIHDNGSTMVGSVPQDHGIYASGANLVVKNSKLYNNYGYGLQLYSSSGSNYSGREIYNNWFYNNGYGSGSATISGMLLSEGSGTIYNNLFFKNAGHGIDLWRTSNVTVYHNSCHQNGKYGIVVGLGSGNQITNTLVKNNISIDNTEGDIRVRSNSTGAVVNWNNVGTSSYTNSGSGTSAANNGFSTVAAGEWVDPTNATLASRDYNLKTGADSIWDATTNNVESAGVATDIEGTSRVHPDQGAYAFGTPDPPDPPVIGHLTNYPVAVWALEDIALTLFDNDSNTTELSLDGSTDGVSIEFGDTTNCTVT